MSRLSRLFQHETFTVWRYSKVDQYNNQTVLPAKEFTGQWEDTYSEYLTEEGARVALTAKIACTDDLDIGSIVFRGVNDTYSTGDQLYRIATKMKAKNPKGRDTRIEYGLSKWNNSLPKIA